MSSTVLIAVLLLLSFIAANLPWLNNRILLFYTMSEGKPVWLRLVEWFFYYLLMGAIAVGMERKITGGIHPQAWEFYAVTISLFLVFAFPGFFYFYHNSKRLNPK